MRPKAVWKNVDLKMGVKMEPGVPVGRPGNGQSAEDTESITNVRRKRSIVGSYAEVEIS